MTETSLSIDGGARRAIYVGECIVVRLAEEGAKDAKEGLLMSLFRSARVCIKQRDHLEFTHCSDACA